MSLTENQSLLTTPPSSQGDDTTFDEISTLPYDDSLEIKNGYNLQLIFVVIVSCLSSIQYGYHMSELNAPELIYSCQKSIVGPHGDYSESFFGLHGYVQCIPLSNHGIGVVTSIFSIGGLMGSIYAGVLADKYGRKLMFSVNAVLFIVGSTIETLAQSYLMISVGRFVSGVGAGSGIVITPMYINEVSPLELRGTLGSMNQVSINIGILLTQLLAIKWANDEQWRFILLMGSAIAVVNFLLVIIIDESPKWLILNGYESQGFHSLMKLRSYQLNRCKYEITHWQNLKRHQTQLQRSKTTLRKFLFSKIYHKVRNVITVIMMGQQFCGINSIIFYGVKVLTSLFPNKSVAINCMISVLNAIVTFAASFIIDSLGRKPMLLISVTIMLAASVGMAIGMLLSQSILSVMSTFIYVGAFAIGLGPIPFLLISEVSQNEVKGMAQSYGTTLNWLATFLVGFLFPILNEYMGGAVYFIFALICLLFVLFTYYQIPETKGKSSYEEVWSISND